MCACLSHQELVRCRQEKCFDCPLSGKCAKFVEVRKEVVFDFPEG